MLNDLAFADDVALLENSAVMAQKQLDAYKENSAKVGLRQNIKTVEQMHLNQPKDANIMKNLIFFTDHKNLFSEPSLF